MKVGLIRCIQTEDMCGATTCLRVMKEKTLAFEGVEGEVSLINVNTCGGCPGKKAVTRAASMVNNGADTIAIASCITKGSPIGFPCPHEKQMIAAIQNKVGENIRVITYTH